MIETLKTESASLKEKMKELEQKGSDDGENTVGVTGKDVSNCQNVDSPFNSVEFIERVIREAQEKLKRNKGITPDVCSNDIQTEHSITPLMTHTADTNTVDIDGGECFEEVRAAQGKGALPTPSDRMTGRNAEIISTQTPQATVPAKSPVITDPMELEENGEKANERSTHKVIEDEEEEKKRREVVDTVKIITDEEIDKMIED